MSKFRKLLGGLAGIGLLTAFAVGGTASVTQAASSHVVSFRADSAAVAYISPAAGCINCVTL
jgi:hypothetical protein